MLGILKTKDNLHDNSQGNLNCVAVWHVQDIPFSYSIHNKMLHCKYFSWDIQMRKTTVGNFSVWYCHSFICH